MKVIVNLYKANWCGYCIKYLPRWELLNDIIKKYENQLSKLKMDVELNIYEETKGEIKESDNIQSFPTIKIGKVDLLEYNDDRNNLEKLLDNIFGTDLDKDKKELIKKIKKDLLDTAKAKNINLIKSGGYFDYRPELKYKRKYLKYKEKYLKLKNKL